jgi:hypothetical protein
MKPEKHDLIETLLDDGAAARRTATLRAGGLILRRRRWQRTAVRGLGCVMAVGLIAAFLHKPAQHKSLALTGPTRPAAPPKSLTDAQLLAMFPDTPVGLVTLKNGQKRLIFLRPDDERKYVAGF